MGPGDTTGLLISLTIGYGGGYPFGRRQGYDRVLPRRDTRDKWFEVNPVIPSGQPFMEADTGAWYIGDGIRTYRQLVADVGPMGIAGAMRRQLAGEPPSGIAGRDAGY